jgi:hypothetical protein
MPAYAHDTIFDLLALAPRVQPDRAAGSMPPGDQAWVVVRELPAAAFMEAAP